MWFFFFFFFSSPLLTRCLLCFNQRTLTSFIFLETLVLTAFNFSVFTSAFPFYLPTFPSLIVMMEGRSELSHLPSPSPVLFFFYQEVRLLNSMVLIDVASFEEGCFAGKLCLKNWELPAAAQLASPARQPAPARGSGSSAHSAPVSSGGALFPLLCSRLRTQVPCAVGGCGAGAEVSTDFELPDVVICSLLVRGWICQCLPLSKVFVAVLISVANRSVRGYLCIICAYKTTVKISQ